MQAGTRRTLEFDRIMLAVGRLAQTRLGREAVARVVPRPDPAEVRARLGRTSEMRRHLALGGSMTLTAPENIEQIRASLQAEGQALEPLELRGLADLVANVEAAAAGIRRNSTELPLLTALVRDLSPFRDEVALVRRAIDPSGDVLDEASPGLKHVRDRLRKQRQALRTAFDRLVRGRESAKYLQDQVVTDRNGRFVVIVRAEHRDSVPGIVHGSSASGASLYVEPMATVPLNNDVVELTEREREEVHKVLVGLANLFRARAADVDAAIDAVATLDALYAMARMGDLTRAIEAEIVDAKAIGAAPVLEWRGARHPLLIPAVRELLSETLPGSLFPVGGAETSKSNPAGDTTPPPTGKSEPGRVSGGPVPVDILLAPPTRTLVISGPNTGGKTVALKAAGLLALMTQAGLHVPAGDGSRMTVFSCIFADIGDEQSIAASLSTFSGHMMNIASMEREFALPALILLDEVGSGTDPVEGGALGMAIVDHFRKRGALVIATTHDDTMKSYGATTDGVTIAAFGFDPETYAPTYRLLYGTAGRSLALEIASRLGIPASVIEAARKGRTTRETQLEAHLARVERDMQALDHDRRLAAKERADAAAEREKLRAREAAIREREQQISKRIDAAVNARVREAREEIDRAIAKLKQKTAALESEARAKGPRLVTTGDLGDLRTEARAAVERAASGARTQPADLDADADAPAYTPKIGDKVRAGGLGFEGIVRAIDGNTAELEVLGKRIKARVADLRLSGQRGSSAGEASGERGKSQVRVNVSLAERESGIASEINVIGSTVDDAVTRVSRFIDEALLTDVTSLRIVHGHGTGQLRKGLGAYLRNHPLVTKVSPAPPNEGGDAVTVIALKD